MSDLIHLLNPATEPFSGYDTLEPSEQGLVIATSRPNTSLRKEQPEGKLFLCNPHFYGREEAKNSRYIGEAKFQFGRGVSYVHAEERVRLPNSNAILSMQTIDLSSGQIFR